ncbi:hypothetical protein [Streptomyces sp. NPDC006997]|uniref:hypothetical protein n=1 Tax=Streptomyces sp. NPDC006997 TaxID=3155356 RepID=UPI00340E3B26
MRGVGATVAVLAVAVALTGCGGGGGDGAAEKPTASARAAEATGTDVDTAAVTSREVRRDIRAAAQAAGEGRLRFVEVPGRLRDKVNLCDAYAFLQTESEPERVRTERVRAVLEGRGWLVDGDLPVEEDGAYGWTMSKGQWTMFLAAGEVPEGAGIALSASASRCELWEPSPRTTGIAPPEPPTPPALR